MLSFVQRAITVDEPWEASYVDTAHSKDLNRAGSESECSGRFPATPPADSVGIGTAAARFGLSQSALRYWEARGLIHPIQLSSRWRRYGPADLHRIALIKMWRQTGLMSLAEIAAIFAADDDSWREAVSERIEVIARQQERLIKAKEHLQHLITCPDADPARDCPYLRAAVADAHPDTRPPMAPPGLEDFSSM